MDLEINTKSTENLEEKTNNVTKSQSDIDAQTPEVNIEIEYDENNPYDLLQKNISEEVDRIIKIVREKNLITKEKDINDLNEENRKLKNTAVKIGFAGMQSAGKSAVINSLLNYPLMPNCDSATTATPVKVVYGSEQRVLIYSNGKEKKELLYDCFAKDIPDNIFTNLKEYLIKTNNLINLENTFYYIEAGFNPINEPKKEDLCISKDNKNAVLFLFLVLFSTCIKISEKNNEENVKEADKIKENIISSLKIDKNIKDFYIICQGPFEILKSGIQILDLPGYGSAVNAAEGAKSHDTIASESVAECDYMFFIMNPSLQRAGEDAIISLINSAKIKKLSDVNSYIIPILNKADTINGDPNISKEQAVDYLGEKEIRKKRDDIRLYSAIYGELNYNDLKNPYYLCRQNIFRNNILDWREEDNLNESQINEKVRNRLRKTYYPSSGIDELKKFCKTDFLNEAKKLCGFSVVTALTNYFNSELADIIAKYNALSKSGKYSKELIEEADDTLKKETSELFSACIVEINTKFNSVNLETDENNPESTYSKLNNVYETYLEVLKKALEAYKDKLKDHCSKFVRNWNGKGTAANFGKPKNVKVFNDLQELIKDFPVDTTPVYNKYVEILNGLFEVADAIIPFIKDKLDELYKNYSKIAEKYNPDKKNYTEDSKDRETDQLLYDLLNDLKLYLSTEINKYIASVEKIEEYKQKLLKNIPKSINLVNEVNYFYLTKKIQILENTDKKI